MSPKSNKFIIYCRVSTLEQNSDLQRRELVEYAEKRGWAYEVLEDKATGKNANRPALQKLLQLAQQRKIDGIAVWRCDRLFRSLKEAVITLSTLTELGVTFYSHKDGIDLSTSHGRLLANMLFSLAEFEIDLQKSRILSGISAARARGVKFGRPQVVTAELAGQVIELRQRGLSVRRISEIVKPRISKTSIERILRVHFNKSSKKIAI